MKPAIWLLVAVMAAGQSAPVLAADYFGQVTFNGLPVPGASITATQGDRVVAATTNEDGIYQLVDLADGAWDVSIEMPGFTTVTRPITMPGEEGKPQALTVRSFDELRIASPRLPANSTFPRTSLLSQGSSSPGTEPASPGATKPLVDLAMLLGPSGIGAADGLLINGSLNNGAATPFALPRAIGNNRPRVPSMRTYAIGLQLGNSAWDARPFSLSGSRAEKPSYTDMQLLGTFESQLRLPSLRNPITLTLGYQGSSATTANMQFARVPTERERAGDFSQTFDARGQPVRIVDPLTGMAFAGGVMPADRISPQALALLNYYPHADSVASGRFNYQAPLVTGTRQDAVRSRATYRFNSRHQLSGGVSYARTVADTASLFRFDDSREVSTFEGQASWLWNPSRNTNISVRYAFTHTATELVPFFANRVNASQMAGITGNDQDPRNWGPPSLTFGSDLAGLTDGIYSSNTERLHAWMGDITRTAGTHAVSIGGEFRLRHTDVLGQQDPRGSFGFTGAASGLDLGDFLLGLPQTSAIGHGNPDKYFRGAISAVYVTDDWHVRPAITLTYGMRWEYESPVTEAQGRLVNLDVATGFSAVSPVRAGEQGALSGRAYSDSLVNADRRGFEPRLGIAWRPAFHSSLIVRAGYGVYRSTNVYQPIASLLAVQPPLATAFNIASTASHPLTLADGFTPAEGATLTTFAVDPDFRVSAAQTWDASVQRDLPGALTVLASYQGARGTNLMQMFLPNTYPPGAANPCPTCPAGFRYLTSDGRSIRHAGSIQIRRRLSGGFASTVQYTLAHARDNAAAFGGATLEGSALMQNWLDPEAEYARSNFDQRHLVTASVEHTTGVGIRGGALVDGWRGRLLKEWTFTAALSAGTGLPLTPVYFAPVAGTGVAGSIRPDVAGVPNVSLPGAYANPAAFTIPAAGRWGNAERNSITGPSTFSLNAGVTRTFRVNSRLNLDWRLDATNVLNRVTYASVNALVTSPQFGLPNRVNDMRKLRTSVRVRF